MSDKNFNELVERLFTIEGEMQLLRDDRKILLSEFKDKLDIKSVQAAIRIAKIKTTLTDTSDESLEEMIASVEKKISV